jgi:large subunit ribosomal protein L1
MSQRGRGKQYEAVSQQVDRSKRYAPKDALSLIKQASFAKFDESIELHFNLGIDPRQADQQIRGTLQLPFGTGKSVRIVVVAQGEKLMEAKEAGADEVGSDELIERIQGGWLDFDLMIATPDMMSKVGRLGRILGARGIMPNPKAGTVTSDLKKAIQEFKAGKVEYRNDKSGLIHLAIGRKSFDVESLFKNFEAVYDTIVRIKPSKAKGVYLRSISLSSTMGPGVFLETQSVKWKEV